MRITKDGSADTRENKLPLLDHDRWRPMDEAYARAAACRSCGKRAMEGVGMGNVREALRDWVAGNQEQDER